MIDVSGEDTAARETINHTTLEQVPTATHLQVQRVFLSVCTITIPCGATQEQTIFIE